MLFVTKLKTTFLTTALLAFVGGYVYAEETTTVEELPPGTEIKTVENPKMDAVREQAEKLAASLSAEEVDDLAKLRDGFGMVRSAQMALDTVESAVEACADENPSLSEAMEARHEAWEDAIGDALEGQEEMLEDSLSEDYFSDVDGVEDYLDAIDDAAEHAESNIEKQIITSESACKNLLDSMDSTQQAITKMLSEISWPAN